MFVRLHFAVMRLKAVVKLQTRDLSFLLRSILQRCWLQAQQDERHGNETSAAAITRRSPQYLSKQISTGKSERGVWIVVNKLAFYPSFLLALRQIAACDDVH